MHSGPRFIFVSARTNARARVAAAYPHRRGEGAANFEDHVDHHGRRVGPLLVRKLDLPRSRRAGIQHRRGEVEERAAARAFGSCKCVRERASVVVTVCDSSALPCESEVGLLVP